MLLCCQVIVILFLLQQGKTRENFLRIGCVIACLKAEEKIHVEKDTLDNSGCTGATSEEYKEEMRTLFVKVSGE